MLCGFVEIFFIIYSFCLFGYRCPPGLGKEVLVFLSIYCLSCLTHLMQADTSSLSRWLVPITKSAIPHDMPFFRSRHDLGRVLGETLK